jgi:hypothetical protein
MGPAGNYRVIDHLAAMTIALVAGRSTSMLRMK